MNETRDQLLIRKRELFATLRVLEQDREDGTIEEGAYRAARRRYEVEAATLLEQLDAIPEHEDVPRNQTVGSMAVPSGGSRMAIGITSGVVLVALTLILITAIHARSGNQAITGSAGQAAASPTALPAAIIRARRAVNAHPKSASAVIALGNAYLDGGDVAAADQQYHTAMMLAPSDPVPRTLHAMVLGSNGRDSAALSLLRRIERNHPTYARAWLLDGLIAAHSIKGYPRAIVSWKRFLVLAPHASISPKVRTWLQGVRKAERAKHSR